MGKRGQIGSFGELDDAESVCVVRRAGANAGMHEQAVVRKPIERNDGDI